MSRMDDDTGSTFDGVGNEDLEKDPDAKLARIDKDHAKRVFARRLRAAMDAKGWTQSETAEQASKFMPDRKKLGRDNVSNYANGKHLPRSPVLKALARALGVDPDELRPGWDTPNAVEVDPPIDLRDLGDGHVFLRISKRIPWPAAIEMLRLAQDPR